MSTSPKTRSMKKAEFAAVEAQLVELRRHFHEWSSGYSSELDLIGFAIYEGCDSSGHCRRVLERSVAYAVGKELVDRDGCRWAMMLTDDGWQHAVFHPAFNTPIPLDSEILARWNRETYDEPTTAIMRVADSYQAIRTALINGSLYWPHHPAAES